MNTLGKDELFRIAIDLDLPNLLSFCASNKIINSKICERNDIWLYKIKKEFPEYQLISNRSPKEQYERLFLFNRPAEYIGDGGVFSAFIENDHDLDKLINPIIMYRVFAPKIVYLLLLNHEKKHNRFFIKNGVTYINASHKFAKWLQNELITLKINPRKISLEELENVAISLFRKFSERTIYKFTPPQLKLIEKELEKKLNNNS